MSATQSSADSFARQHFPRVRLYNPPHGSSHGNTCHFRMFSQPSQPFIQAANFKDQTLLNTLFPLNNQLFLKV